MDNAPVHNSATVKKYMEENNLHCAPHPPYSPDLAPSDFYLFGALKSRIRDQVFVDRDEIKEWITDQIQMTSKDELMRVFTAWEERLRRCIAVGGGYVE